MELVTLPSTEEEAVKFLQEKGIFPKQLKCPAVQDHRDMRLHFTEKRGIFWRCSKDACNSRRISIKSGTWFRSCNISLAKALRFLYSWAQQLTSVKWCKEQLGMNPTTTSDWNRCVRDVISEELDRRPCRKIGGEGLIVEVDDTVLTKNRGGAGGVSPRQWIVGGICRETRQCFLKMLPERSASAFLDVIKENVAEGSTVYSDCWKEYGTPGLEAAGLQQLTASHRLNFVDASTAEEHFKTIDGVWGSLKWRSKRQMGLTQQYLDSYLAEFIWRQEIGDADPFEALLEAIKRSPLKEHCNCEHCGLILPNQKDLRRHLLEVHGFPEEVVEHQKNTVENLPQSCPACDVRPKDVVDLIHHANEVHEFDGMIKQEVFPSYSAFEQWKEEIEEEHNTHWIRRSERTEHGMYYAQFRCQRRRIKKRKHDTKAEHRSCTSFINVTRELTSGAANVEYCLEHFGHEQEPQKPWLRWSVKLEIAEMLKLGLPVAEIVRVLQNEKDGALEGRYSVTVKDVRSVAAKLKVDPGMFETKGNIDTEVRFKTESDPAESSPKEEPSSLSPSFAESSMRRGLSPIGTTSPEALFETGHSSAEYSVCGRSIKEEPESAANLLDEPSTRREPVLAEPKSPSDDGVRAFILTTMPDEKGFALVDQPLV